MEAFTSAVSKNSISPVAVHACYLINPCTTDQQMRDRTIKRLASELTISARLNAEYYVIHPGSTKDNGKAKGIEQAAETLVGAATLAGQETDKLPVLLLENTAGDYGPGGTFTALGALRTAIAKREKSLKVGFVIDTCHAHASGYDLNSQKSVVYLRREAEKHLGFRNIALLHANDSVHAAGSGRDQHQHIGKGTIGEGGFSNFFSIPRFRELPIILETPWESEKVEKQNLSRLQKILYQIQARDTG